MHWSGTWVLLVFLVVCAGTILYVLHLTRAGVILHERIPDRPRRRLFVAAVSFFLTFLSVRIVMVLIYLHVGPFGWVVVGGQHIHHMVWGILLLLVSGYAMVAELGTDATPMSLLASRLASIGYGMGAALTLDEFTMWLTVRDSAWSFRSEQSIHAVVLFGVLLWTKRQRKPRRKLSRRSAH